MKLKKGASFYRNCGGVVAGGYYKFFFKSIMKLPIVKSFEREHYVSSFALTKD